MMVGKKKLSENIRDINMLTKNGMENPREVELDIGK